MTEKEMEKTRECVTLEYERLQVWLRALKYGCHNSSLIYLVRVKIRNCNYKLEFQLKNRLSRFILLYLVI